jgi:hypothetical protein
LSRPEVIAISRTADAIVAMLTVLGVVDLLRDVSAMRRKRMLALLPVADTVRRDDRRWLLLLLMLAGAMAVVWGLLPAPWLLLGDGGGSSTQRLN